MARRVLWAPTSDLEKFVVSLAICAHPRVGPYWKGGWGPLRARSRRSPPARYRRASRRRARGRERTARTASVSPAHQKLENFRVVETRRDVTSFSLETLRVPTHVAQEECPRWREILHKRVSASQKEAAVDETLSLCRRCSGLSPSQCCYFSRAR